MVQTAVWLVGLPVFNALWADWCHYSLITITFAYVIATNVSLAYLLTPIPLDEPSEEDAVEKKDGAPLVDTVEELGDEEKALKLEVDDAVHRAAREAAIIAHKAELQAQKLIAIMCQLTLGAISIFGFMLLYIEPAASLPAAISSSLLNTVGFMDTLAFLGPWLGARWLVKCTEGFDNALSGVSSSADGADEALRDGFHNLVDLLNDPKRRLTLIPLPVIRFVSQHIPSLLPYLTNKKREKKQVLSPSKHMSYWERTRHEAAIEERKKALARQKSKSVGKGAWKRAKAKVTLLTKMRTWWEPHRKRLGHSYISWLNDTGYLARQAPAKVFVSLLDLYSLIEFLIFLTTHAHIVGYALLHGEHVDEFTHGVQASLLALCLTYAAATDFVSAITKPEEFERRRAEEDARIAERKKRAAREKLISDAMKPPTVVTKLENALQVAEDSGNGVSAFLLRKLQDELQAAVERDKRGAKGRVKAIEKLEKAMIVTDPFKADVAMIEEAVEIGRHSVAEEGLPAEFLLPAEQLLLKVKRTLQDRTDTLRRMFRATGEDVLLKGMAAHASVSVQYEALMKKCSPKLLKRIKPDVRKANRVMLELLKQQRAAGLSSLAKATTKVPGLNLDTKELESAIKHARELRVPAKICDAATLILEDLLIVGIEHGDTVSLFASRLRQKVRESRERKDAAAKLNDARSHAEEALGNVRLTRKHTIPLIGALEDLEKATNLAREKRVEDALIDLALLEHEEMSSLIQQRRMAKVALEHARAQAAAIMEAPRSISQPTLDEAISQLTDAVTDAEQLSVPVDQVTVVELHQHIMDLLSKRRRSIRMLNDLLAEVHRTGDMLLGNGVLNIGGKPMPTLRKEIAVAREVGMHEEFVAHIEGRAVVHRFPWAQLKVRMKACFEILPQHIDGTMGRLDEYDGDADGVEAAVKGAMAKLELAWTELRASCEHLHDMGSANDGGEIAHWQTERGDVSRIDLLKEGEDLAFRAEDVWRRYVEEQILLNLAMTNLRVAMEEYRNQTHDKPINRSVKVKWAKKLREAILRGVHMVDPILPDSYLEPARVAVKPLYDATNFNGRPEAPLLYEKQKEVMALVVGDHRDFEKAAQEGHLLRGSDLGLQMH